MLLDNTSCSFELIVSTTTPKCPYKIWNEAAARASAEVLVFSNSDVLMAPGWDKPFLEHMCDNAILTGYLVEPGVEHLGVASCNIRMCFGVVPAEFAREAFEAYAVAESAKNPPVIEMRAWYMPCAMRRDWFLGTSGFDTANAAFPTALDCMFWDKVSSQGAKLLRVPSYAYHFQNLSART